MAKKIRNVKLHEQDIQKNSGKNISHTINKIKAHEREYTVILVLFFMVVISISLYFALRVDSYNIYANEIDRGIGFSYTSRLVYLNNMNKENNKELYNIEISNMTDYNTNYVVKIIPDTEKMKECNCNIISSDKLRYSLEDNIERQFTKNDMFLTTGFISSLEKKDITLSLWISEEESKEEYFYGQIILEKIG